MAVRPRPRRTRSWTADTIDALLGYPWPGNIRDQYVIHRALLVCDGNHRRPRDLNLPLLPQAMATGEMRRADPAPPPRPTRPP
jgi:transcriptional regulator of acetoin/glycerol metabolism